MKISMGADHAGYLLKKAIKEVLVEAGHWVTDHGTHSEESVDYPDFGKPVCEDVEAGRAECGILVCYTGNGMAMTANRFPGIRAALVHYEEDARLTRAHNNANVLVLSGLHCTPQWGRVLIKAFLETDFEGGRHARRIGKISCGPGTEPGSGSSSQA